MRSLEPKCASSSDSKRTVAQLARQSEGYKEAFLGNAVALGLFNLVRCALEAKISANTCSDSGDKNPVLVEAAGCGYFRIVKQLLDAGADHSLTDRDGFSALNAAAQEGHLECIQLLLAAGADANKQESAAGLTPLLTAIARKHTDCVRALLPVSDLLRTSRQGTNVFHFCVNTANAECFDVLLPLVSDVDVRTLQGVDGHGQATTFFGQSALMLACQKGQQQMAKALLKRGADRMARDSLQRTSCHYSSANGHLSCLTLLIGQPGRRKMTPAEVDAADVNGWTAIHLAAFHGFDKIAACCWRRARGWMQRQRPATHLWSTRSIGTPPTRRCLRCSPAPAPPIRPALSATTAARRPRRHR